MSPIPLNKFDELILKQIVMKFSFRSVATFYLSCRAAKEFVDGAKLLWHLSRLRYRGTSREAYRFDQEVVPPEVKFCGAETVEIHPCETRFLKEVILPELEASGAVGLLNLKYAQLKDRHVGRVLAAANPVMVQVSDRYYGEHFGLFENVKHLVISIDFGYAAMPTTRRVFEFGRNKRTICLNFILFDMDVILHLLENWMQGEPTGSLEKLTVYQLHGYPTPQHKEMLWIYMEKLMRNFVKTPEGYVVRRGLKQLRIVDSAARNIDIGFHFS